MSTQGDMGAMVIGDQILPGIMVCIIVFFSDHRQCQGEGFRAMEIVNILEYGKLAEIYQRFNMFW